MRSVTEWYTSIVSKVFCQKPLTGFVNRLWLSSVSEAHLSYDVSSQTLTCSFKFMTPSSAKSIFHELHKSFQPFGKDSTQLTSHTGQSHFKFPGA